MVRMLLLRLLQTIPTILGVTFITFVLVRLTGDPAAIMLPPDAPAEAVAQFRQQYGLDRPLPVQYWLFLTGLLKGNLGTSIRYDTPVSELIVQRAAATLELTVSAMLLAVVVGGTLGVLGAVWRGGWIDSFGRFIAVGGQAIPTFYLGIVLILVFGVWLRVFPTVGAGGLQFLVLPSITLASFLIPLVLRVTRGSVLDEIGQDFVRTARSKGMRESRVIRKHVLKAALIPVITVIGLQVGGMLGGAVITETVFSWPGLGQLLVNAISTRDFPVVQGLVVFAAAAFIAVNLVVDIIYRLLDPRVRLS